MKPDVRLGGSVDVFISYLPGFNWEVVGGTSEASPEFAGIVAMADQMAGHN